MKFEESLGLGISAKRAQKLALRPTGAARWLPIGVFWCALFLCATFLLLGCTATGSASDERSQFQEVGVAQQALVPIASYAGTDPRLSHGVGSANGTAWAVAAGQPVGALSYGPYTNQISVGSYVARFTLLVDDNVSNDELVATIDVNDAEHDNILVRKTLTRRQFAVGGTAADFDLQFESPAGAVLEFRVNYLGHGRLEHVQTAVYPVSPAAALLTYLGSDSHHGHAVGYRNGNSWAVAANQSTGTLSYGPYTTQLPVGTYVARFTLLVDNNSADDAEVATIDVNDYGRDTVLARRSITRKNFAAGGVAGDFELQFSAAPNAVLEFRVHFEGHSYLEHVQTAVYSVTPPPALVTYAGSDSRIGHLVGYPKGTAWAVNADQSRTTLSYGPYTQAIPAGSYVARFNMLVDDNSFDDKTIATIDVNDYARDTVLATRTLTRKQFGAAGVASDFDLPFTAATNAVLEFRIFYRGSAHLEHVQTSVYSGMFASTLRRPRVDDFTASPRERVQALVNRALDGLGFPDGSADGPQPADRVFVGKRYIAWIDQTGFVGKLNGLWPLNGADGNALDFVLTDPDARPVNFLALAEDGDGRWPAGYAGSEHIEFPNRTPEPNDNQSCGTKSDWCNQYGLNEAPDITNSKIPWWSACNAGAPAWLNTVSPVISQSIAGGLKLVYEAPLVKEADGDGNHDGDSCHQDWLFSDGVRRRVYLRVGYELLADSTYVDRTMQFRNPSGNPQFSGPMSLIGGFVMTRFPNAHYLKRLDRYIRPEVSNVYDTTDQMTLYAGQWNAHLVTPTNGDEVYGWLGQPVSLSDSASYMTARSATLSHVGPQGDDNNDVGFCLCRVHGGLEMGGGLLHGSWNQVAPGSVSIEAKRRLTIGSSGWLGTTFSRTYQAENALSHAVGRVDGDGWSAATVPDTSGHLVFGPYATDWGNGPGQASFFLQVDNNTAEDLVVAVVDVHDASTGVVLSSREIHRKEFRSPFAYQRFVVNFDLVGRSGHSMETRVYWRDLSYVKVDKVVVSMGDGTYF